ncbi:MAG: polysaccharide biosynthesis/export family protein, partial [Nitrospirae bacterium]|nr:polysaccharide biosynthesis/export family protein [Nitrospirota bacterium]
MMIHSMAIMGIIVAMTAATALAQSKPSAVSPLHESVHEKSSLTVTTDYIIGPEDVLEISVWRNADLSKIVEVRPDGRISLPLIGDVIAVGRTASQLAD